VSAIAATFVDPRSLGVEIIDCDVHANVPDIDVLVPYLGPHWQEYVAQSAFNGPADTAYPSGVPTTTRPDLKARDEAPASTLEQIRHDIFGELGATHAVVHCAYGIESIHNPDAAVAVAQAVNDWLIAEWLEPEPRLRAAMVVPSKSPEAAAAEIERVGDHEQIVQVFLPVRSSMPYGKRAFHPLFRAAVRHQLAVGLHFGGAPGNPPTAAGWPSYYVEEYAGMPSAFQSQVMSLVVEGVFDEFPDLRVILVEGGFGWLPAFLWRFDKEWKGLRRETPWVRKFPSEYVRDHMWATLQPLDVPDGPTVGRLMELLQSEEFLLFATDYPHWHFDSLDAAFPAGLDEDVARQILSTNARRAYALG
jgi:predicted TIM-barrel fold metal-dependent hydrolase